MKLSLTRLARLTVMTVVVGVVVAWPAPAQARMVPETLADRRPVQAGPVEPGFPIDYLGVLWESPAGEVHEDVPGDPEPHGAVRFRVDGRWGAWVPLIEDGADGGDDVWASGLVAGGDAEAYQVRGIPADGGDPRAVAINTTDGELEKVGETRGGANALDSAKCQSRADWGADEGLRFDSSGNEVWPPTFHDAQVMTVHHTATDNNDPDPESTVRAIYRYHAVDQGWGDIGYQYLVDESGVVYEGRWSGERSIRCEGTAGGDGADFAHEADDRDADGVADEIVTAAHTGGWNSGNIGVALLGEFTDHPRFGGDPKAAAVASLEDVLAELAVRHDLDPLNSVQYVNPVSNETKTVETIAGHRDYTATECPGQRLYDQLPTIRQNVAAKMSAPADAPPTVDVTSPADGETVSGTIPVTADAGDDNGVYSVELLVDGTSIGTDSDGTDGWSASWDTTAYADGGHTVTATATDTADQTAGESVSVTVDNGGSEPTPTTMHVADLDGTAQSNKSDWWATVTIKVVDSAGNPVSGAQVSGTWTPTGATVLCTTESDGTCAVTSTVVHKRTETLTFRVDGLSGGALTYESSANTDPDGDSNGTTITVPKA